MADRRLSFDVAVLGAGPAGIAAACTASESGRRVVALDHMPSPGGPIWRGRTAGSAHRFAHRWMDRLMRSGATVLAGATAFAAPAPNTISAETSDGIIEIEWQKLVLATGARELFIPFPGWTLPNVFGAGGLQVLAKTGWPVAGKRVLVAGSGPLLIAAAAGLKEAGAAVVLVAEQADLRHLAGFAAGLIRLAPGKLAQAMWYRLKLGAVPYRSGCWPTAAEGRDRVQRVVLTDGTRSWREPCDCLACSFGLIANLEWPQLLGCRIEMGTVCVDQWQETSVTHVYCAGEPTGIGGVDRALIEGQIAGYAAAGRQPQARALFRARDRARRFTRRLRSAFTLRPELKQGASDDTLVCRCEDVTRRELASYSSWRAAKLHTRCGMGACQGRVCGAAAGFLFGWENDSIRPPVFPVKVGSLAGMTSQGDPPARPESAESHSTPQHCERRRP